MNKITQSTITQNPITIFTFFGSSIGKLYINKLCIECNLKKSDKELMEIALEEKARQFLSGKSFKDDANKEDLEDDDFYNEDN